LLDLSIHDLYAPILFNEAQLDVWNAGGFPVSIFDQITIADSSITHSVGGQGGNGVYISATRFAYLGNVIDDTIGTEHGMRVPYADRAVISNNLFSRAAGVDSGYGGKTTLTVRAPVFGGSPTIPAGAFTEKVVVSDNKFVPHTTQNGNTGSGPKADSSDERLRDCIWERNWWTTAPGGQMQVQFALTGSEFTLRNNIIEVSGSSSDNRVFRVQMTNVVGGYPVPNFVRFYNNSAYSSDTGSNFVMVQLDPSVTNVSLINNLAYAPGDASPVLRTGTGAAGLVESNNSTNLQIKTTSPAWTSVAPSAPSGFGLTAVSYATNAGGLAPVWSDFFRTARPNGGAIDLGAVEF